MEIIPAIDLREGECARILEPNKETEAIRSNDPVEQAIILRDLGATWVHITDLDGAFSGHLYNLDVLKNIKEESGLKIQHHGGVRRLEHVDTLLELGVDRVVMGTQMLRDRALCKEALSRYGERVLPGVDGRDGMVMIEGFAMKTADSVLKLLEQLKEMGFDRVLYTDRRRVGALKGVNIEGVKEIMAYGLSIMVAGGVNDYDSIAEMKLMGVDSLIIGKAIYSGALKLPEAMEIAKK